MPTCPIETTDWADPGADPGFDAAALLFVRACALVGIYAKTALCRKVAERLSPAERFLTVFLAATCLKLPVFTQLLDLAELSDEQYDCMLLLDNFQYLPGSSWG